MLTHCIFIVSLIESISTQPNESSCTFPSDSLPLSKLSRTILFVIFNSTQSKAQMANTILVNVAVFVLDQ